MWAGVEFPCFLSFPSACQKQARGGSLKDTTARREKPEHSPFSVDPPGTQKL